MKVVIFCGGMGLRLRGYVDDVPKPMAQIGQRPLIWHLMKYYAHFGHKDFVLCLGYKGDAIKNYFLNYEETVSNDFVWSQGGKKIDIVNRDIDDWTVTFVDTGINSNIGMRLKAVEPLLRNEEMFLANYGDGLSDLNLPVMIDELTKRPEAIGSLLLVQPTASFDIVNMTDNGEIGEILPLSKTNIWINGGFFVFRNAIFNDLHHGEELVREPFGRLIERRALLAHRAHCFWQCMDTFKDKQYLEELNHTSAPWKVWTRKPPLTMEVSK